MECKCGHTSEEHFSYSKECDKCKCQSFKQEDLRVCTCSHEDRFHGLNGCQVEFCECNQFNLKKGEHMKIKIGTTSLEIEVGNDNQVKFINIRDLGSYAKIFVDGQEQRPAPKFLGEEIRVLEVRPIYTQQEKILDLSLCWPNTQFKPGDLIRISKV